jgi:hypothetical protein
MLEAEDLKRSPVLGLVAGDVIGVRRRCHRRSDPAGEFISCAVALGDIGCDSSSNGRRQPYVPAFHIDRDG